MGNYWSAVTAMLASEQKNMTYKNERESKVHSHTAKDNIVGTQTGLNMQIWEAKPYKKK